MIRAAILCWAGLGGGVAFAAPPPMEISLAVGATGAPLAGSSTIFANAFSPAGIAGVQFQLDGKDLGEPVKAPPYAVRWNTTEGPGGSHILSVAAFDGAGNRAASEAVLVSVDNVAPSVVLMNPAPGAVLASTVTLSANAVDNVGVAAVQFRLDGVDLGPRLSSAPYIMAWNTAIAPDGEHTVAAVAWDASANLSTSSAAVTIRNSPAFMSDATPSGAAADDSLAKAPQKFLIPAQSDQAVFGPAAAEVSIFDLSGRLVFHASGGSPIIWNCRNSAGAVVASGVYAARITTRGSKRVHQSFAVVK